MSPESLFDGLPSAGAPLSDRMRPRRLDEVVGQQHLVGPEGFLRRSIGAGSLPSMILWGPPGSGKTTLARLLAREVGAELMPVSAVTSGVKDVRERVERARQLRDAGARAVLFIDEIHRFHRGQQDALLPHVEQGTIVLIGATTENPAHSVVSPLLSRCRVLSLQPLDEAQLERLLARALDDSERGLDASRLEVPAGILSRIAEEAEGDARRALDTLEIAARLARARAGGAPASVADDDVRQALQQRTLRADRRGDAHYDLASAFIKSMRGSDPDAAAYYLMRLLEGGEDPRFLARRMIIFAAEDVGLADPRALQLAVSAAEGFERVGLPEGSLPLTEAAVYLAVAPKSNAVIAARDAAARAAREHGSLPVPNALRDAHAATSRELGHGEGYRYPHDEPGHHAPVDYLPRALVGSRFYRPSDQGLELKIGERVERLRNAVARARSESRHL
jgi:putative ATPase